MDKAREPGKNVPHVTLNLWLSLTTLYKICWRKYFYISADRKLGVKNTCKMACTSIGPHLNDETAHILYEHLFVNIISFLLMLLA